MSGELPAFVREIAHEHDTLMTLYIPGCRRCDTEALIVELRQRAYGREGRHDYEFSDR